MTLNDFSERYTYDASRDLLGEGGFGRVYRAWDNEEHEYVALKMQLVAPMHLDLRLRNEFNKVQQHRHRYIARYKDCYTFNTINGEMDVAVMKYYKDGSLDQLLNSGKLNLQARYAMLRQILEGIVYLHQNNIIHRDLKPQNILIVEHDGRYAPLITDFGISKQIINGQSSAVSNSVMGGTYAYASPEQLKETTIRKNTDLWSFGIIAYIMLTGSAPFNCGTFSPTSQEGRQEQFRQMTSGILPDTINNIPEPWQRLIRECLVVDNNKRIAHAKDALSIVNTSDSECGDSVDIAYLKGDESTIVEGKTTPDSKQSILPTNKLYRKYAISALVFSILFWGLGQLSIAISDYFTSCWGSVHDFERLSSIFVTIGLGGFADYFIPFLQPTNLLQWLALIGIYVSVRGFTRAQISPDDASAVRKVSYGVMLAIISIAILPITSPLPKMHFLFFACLQYVCIALSIWGISSLIKSQYQTQAARTGLRILRIFLFVLIPLNLFSDLLTIIYLFNTEMYKYYTIYLDQWTWSDKGWYYWLMALTNGTKVITSLLALFGIGKVALSRNEVEAEPYNALCEANDQATSEHRSLRIWLYVMGAAAIYTTLWSLHSSALEALDPDHHGIVIRDHFWFDLYYRIFGVTSIDYWWHNWDLSLQHILPRVFATALAVWLLLNSNIRRNKGAMLSLAGTVLSALILPTCIFLTIGLSIILMPIFSMLGMFELVDLISIPLSLVIVYDITLPLILFCTLLFVWHSGLKRYTKIALSITLSYSIISALCWSIGTFADNMGWMDFREGLFSGTLSTIGGYVGIAEVAILLISAAQIAPFTKQKWVKWFTIAFAALFTALSLYGYYSINAIEENRITEEERRAKRAELNLMVRDGLGRNGVYTVGDYYNRDGLEGIVFEVSSDGRHGKIVSLNETKAKWDSLVYPDYYGDVGAAYGGTNTNATSDNDGKANTDKLMARSDSYRFYAAQWCRDKGAEWYLPSISELGVLINNLDQIRNYQEPKDDYEYGYAAEAAEISLYDEITVYDARHADWDGIYWSSTETGENTAIWAISYETVDFGPGDDYDCKYNQYKVRAIAQF